MTSFISISLRVFAGMIRNKPIYSPSISVISTKLNGWHKSFLASSMRNEKDAVQSVLARLSYDTFIVSSRIPILTRFLS